MKYELNIKIDVDDTSGLATLLVDGINKDGEDCHFIFTDSDVAKTLYNTIIMAIWETGTNGESDVYEVEDTVDEKKELKSQNILRGEFVEEVPDEDEAKRENLTSGHSIKDIVNTAYDNMKKVFYGKGENDE